MDHFDDVVETNRIKMRELLSTHIRRVQGYMHYYKNPTIYEPKILNREYDPRCDWSCSSSTASSSSASSSSSNTPTLLPLLFEGKNADLLRVVNTTLRTMDKTLGKQLKKTKNKKTWVFKILLICRKFFNRLKRPMYAALGMIGVYTSLAHFLYMPDSISTLIVSSAAIKDVLNGKAIDDY